MAQQQLTPSQKGFFIAMLIVGPIVLVVGLIYGDRMPELLSTLLPGLGAAMATVGFTMLFWRPDFPNRKDN